MRWLPLVVALIVLAGFGLALGGRAEVVHADGAWLDAAPAQWNVPGGIVPAAPADDSVGANLEMCGRFERAPETAEDAAVALAGWRLFSSYEAGWGVKVIKGLTGYDGMCRPWGFQEFVFVDGQFAGTISPELMNSRFDGVVRDAVLQSADNITASFSRYADTDPLCCPSRTSFATYRIERTDDGPMLALVSVSTQPNS